MNEDGKPDEKKIWFPAKKYGWGWGPPNCWQGWLALFIYIGLLVAGAFLFRPDKHPFLFVGFVILLSSVLTILCYFKGEKPGWRWGGK